jgi:nitrite reductase/ring-hydroxylating ferredoxin subunit
MTSTFVVLNAAGPLGRQWLPVASSVDIEEGPAAAGLLGRTLVVWRGPSGAVIAAPDQCTHSKGDLTKGEVNDGRLMCPKHGWTFGDEGRCVFKPSGLPINDKAHLQTYPCTERYGLIWVSLNDPDDPVVELPWDGDGRYRRIHERASLWQSSAIHVMEMLLAEDDSPFIEISAELPFIVHGTFKSDDGAEHRRLVSCAPVDNRRSLVTSVLWASGSTTGDDAQIAERALADLDEKKSTAEAKKGPASAEIASAEASFADWKRRLLTFVGQGLI